AEGQHPCSLPPEPVMGSPFQVGTGSQYRFFSRSHAQSPFQLGTEIQHRFFSGGCAQSPFQVGTGSQYGSSLCSREGKRACAVD
uniref:Uncharacterized protein n=1 Tax=Gopherus evgoodei TaxID=1825980 RepID=A0A8C4YD85_9SAUR